MHVSINERMLIAQYHKQEKEIKELKDKLLQYRESFQTMKDNLTDVKTSKQSFSQSDFSFIF